MSKPPSGYIQEMFFSLQGEGPWIGKPQWFIRLAGCRRRCRYCDTSRARSHTPRTWDWWRPGSLVSKQLKNPAGIDEILGKIKSPHAKLSMAITGGEPLEQPEFVLALVSALRRHFNSIDILMETNGLEYKDIADIYQMFDFISMDIKVKSSSGITGALDQHALFLKKIKNTPGCAKIVAGTHTSAAEIAKAGRLLQQYQPEWELIIQPVEPIPRNAGAFKQHMLHLLEAAAKQHAKVRLLPQMHKWFGVK